MQSLSGELVKQIISFWWLNNEKFFCYSCLALSILLLLSFVYFDNKHEYNTIEKYSSTNKFDDGLDQYDTPQEFEKTEVIDRNIIN